MAEGPKAEQAYIATLLEEAIAHCRDGTPEAVDDLYRNKSRSYFDKLKNNIMVPYTKDGGGNPRNPMNGNLAGVSFGVTLRNGDLPDESPYGDTRVKVPLKRIFDESAKLYFADFYRVIGERPTHYVILVLTKPGTEAGDFCQQHLLPLNESDNTFLKKEGGMYSTLSQDDVWVEVFCTGEVDISNLDLTTTEVIKKAYVAKLLDKADEHCRVGNFQAVSVLYRNKRRSYFTDLKNKTMAPYKKDIGGDPGNPMNGNLDGLFFGVTLWMGDLPTVSPYGDTRVKVPLERVFDESARLYFADFYCMLGQRNNHYVILVLTKPDTPADVFCQQHLIRLNESNNTFLVKKGATYDTLNQKNIWVEVFYTSEVDISDLDLTETQVLGRGSSSGGITKTSGCRICCV